MLLKKAFDGVINGINFHLHHKLNYGIKPTFLIYQITQRCNGKCVMCRIWNKKLKKELKINDISKVLSNRFFDDLRWIVLTGGEPFLRDDLVDVIEMLNKLPNLKWITIHTNGFLTKKIINNVKAILKILNASITLNITVSINNISAMHDKIMGVPTAYDKATNTLKSLKKIKNKNFDLQVSCVISKKNLEKLNMIEEELKKKCVNLNFIYPTISKYFENKNNKEIKFKKIEKRTAISFLKSIKPENLISDYYLRKQILSLSRNKRGFVCLGGYRTIFINSIGGIFPCLHLAYNNSNYKFGNFLHGDLNEIWFSHQANLIRKKLKNCKTCKNCIISCDMINNIENEFFQFAFFLFRHPIMIKKLFKKINYAKLR